ncbi:hypothetical protein AAEX28_13225 [Lentisphaerota bacterium WC36G]|nr:hypothetical protein LJT99_16055 [Lentisphaerae bacterium WC36]
MSNFIDMIDFHSMIATYNLEVSDSMKNASNTEINNCYNGCGADWMPTWSRVAIDEVVRLFRGAIAVHDWDFSHSDGTLKSFDLANARFWRNMKKIINYLYSYWNIFDYPNIIRQLSKARTLYRFVDLLGWKAWVDAFNTNQMLNTAV